MNLYDKYGDVESAEEKKKPRGNEERGGDNPQQGGGPLQPSKGKGKGGGRAGAAGASAGTSAAAGPSADQGTIKLKGLFGAGTGWLIRMSFFLKKVVENTAVSGQCHRVLSILSCHRVTSDLRSPNVIRVMSDLRSDVGCTVSRRLQHSPCHSVFIAKTEIHDNNCPKWSNVGRTNNSVDVLVLCVPSSGCPRTVGVCW